MSAGIRFGYRNLEHTPEATFVVKQRGFVLICSIEKSAYSARTAHPFQRNGAPFRFKLSKAQQVD